MSRFLAAVLSLACFASLVLPSAAAGEPTRHDSKFVKMSEIPKNLLTGQVFKVSCTFKNLGSESWGPEISKNVVLRSQEPLNNSIWGTFFVIQGQGTNVPPGAEFTFSSELQAPGKPGEYVFQWRLGKMDRGEYRGPATVFGEATPRLVIRVEQRPEAPVAQLPPEDPSGKQVLGFEDFEYIGSFKVPQKVGAGGAGYSESGLALRKAEDGVKRLLMNYTYPSGTLFEVEIPEPMKMEHGNHAPLHVAQVKKVWGAIQASSTSSAQKQETIVPNGGFWWDEGKRTLYWTSYNGYWVSGLPRRSVAATKLEADGTMTRQGPWYIPHSMMAYWGGVTLLPREFADKYAGGRTLALGFGGVYSGAAGCSRGPALCAIAEPDPAKTEVDQVELLVYPGRNAKAMAPRDGNYFTGRCSYWNDPPESPTKGFWSFTDYSRSGVFIDLPKKHAFIAFCRLGTGRMGYDYGGTVSAGVQECWFFYDPKELGAAAQGAKKPWEVSPRSRTNVASPGRPGDVTGSCFDAEERTLYLYRPQAYPLGLEYHPLIHVYRIK
jgi:hypothetical protein